jgi:uncharacterized protein (DUF1800 family)
MAPTLPLLSHLLRRAGFGASPTDLTTYGALSYGQSVDRLVNYTAIPDTVDSHIGAAGYLGTTSTGAFSPNTVINDARQRWLFRMLHTDRPLQERMTLFWHNYFATGFSKVSGSVGAANGTRLMAAKASEDVQQQTGQIELLRNNALGNFRQLLIGVAQDPAMLIWLDGNTNTKAKPQENFGRELMELFSRGVGFYTESDVYAAARVFTGWNLQSSLSDTTDPSAAFNFIYRPEQHETSAKTFSFPIYPDGGTTIPSRAASGGMQDGIDLMTALASHPETATRLMGKLYAFFVSETNPNPAFVASLAATYLRNDTEMAPVIRMILTSAEFQSNANIYTRYSWPAEFVVRAMKETGWVGFSAGSVLSPLVNMNQQLFEPPDVSGWALGQTWFSTGAMLARMNFASALASNQKFKLAAAVADAGARGGSQDVVDFLLTRFTPALNTTMYGELTNYAAAGGAWTGSDAQLQIKAPGLAHLIVGAPEYQIT